MRPAPPHHTLARHAPYTQAPRNDPVTVRPGRRRASEVMGTAARRAGGRSSAAAARGEPALALRDAWKGWRRGGRLPARPARLNLSCARPRNDRNKSALLAVNLAAKADGMPGRTPCEEEQSVSEAPTTLSDATTTPGTLSRRVSFSDDAKKPLEHMCAPHPHKELPRSPYR